MNGILANNVSNTEPIYEFKHMRISKKYFGALLNMLGSRFLDVTGCRDIEKLYVAGNTKFCKTVYRRHQENGIRYENLHFV